MTVAMTFLASTVIVSYSVTQQVVIPRQRPLHGGQGPRDHDHNHDHPDPPEVPQIPSSPCSNPFDCYFGGGGDGGYERDESFGEDGGYGGDGSYGGGGGYGGEGGGKPDGGHHHGGPPKPHGHGRHRHRRQTMDCRYYMVVSAVSPVGVVAAPASVACSAE